MEGVTQTLVAAAIINVGIILIIVAVFAVSRRPFRFPSDRDLRTLEAMLPCGPPNTNLLRNPDFANPPMTQDTAAGLVQEWADGVPFTVVQQMGRIRASAAESQQSDGLVYAFLSADGAYLQQIVTGLKPGCYYRFSFKATAKPKEETMGSLRVTLDGTIDLMPLRSLSTRGVFVQYGPFVVRATSDKHILRIAFTLPAKAKGTALIANVALTT